jgi:hypothetical protein
MEFTLLDSHKDGKQTLLKFINPLSSIQKTRSWLELCFPTMEMQTNRMKSHLKSTSGFTKSTSFIFAVHSPNNLNPLDLLASMIESSQEKAKLFLLAQATQLRESNAIKCLISGGVAGAISRTATAPLDRLKLILQVQTGQNALALSQCVRKILQEGGMSGFYKGNGTNIIKIAPETGIKFFVYEKLKNKLSDDQKTISPHQRFLAGSTAGVIAQSTIYPLECVKTRLALAKPGTYKGIIDCLQTAVQRE